MATARFSLTPPGALHEPFDPMQAAGDAFGEQVVPDTAGTVGAVAANMAGPDPGTDQFIVSGTLRWRNANEIERIWVINPAHPIAQGIEPYIELREEMYGEPFDIPPPDELIFISWFEGGEVFRSGATWQRGKGKVFYFRPGHETNPTYHHPAILRVLENAVRWAVFSGSTIIENRGHKDSPPLSPIQPS